MPKGSRYRADSKQLSQIEPTTNFQLVLLQGYAGTTKIEHAALHSPHHGGPRLLSSFDYRMYFLGSTIPQHETVVAQLAALAAALHADQVAAASAACMTMQTFHASLPTRSMQHRRCQLCACQPHTVSKLFQGHGGPLRDHDTPGGANRWRNLVGDHWGTIDYRSHSLSKWRNLVEGHWRSQ